MVIDNKSSTNYTYTIILVKGYINGGTITAPSGYTLITDTYDIPTPGSVNDKIIAFAGNCTSWSSGFSGVCVISSYDDNSRGQTGQWLVKLIAVNKLASTSWGVYNTTASSGTYSYYKNDWTGTTTGVKANANVILNDYNLENKIKRKILE